MLPPKAYLFIGLNAVRALSILTLLLVFSSSILVMVNDIHAIKKGYSGGTNGNDTVTINGEEFYYDCDYLENSTVPHQAGGAMFAIINRLFIIFQCIIFTASELSVAEGFFANFIPVLGPQFGVGILGALQVFMGGAVLSHHVSTFALVSAFFLFAIGCLNVLLGLTFRASIKTKRALMSWRERASGILPQNTNNSTFSIVTAKGAAFSSVFGSADKEATSGANDGGHGGYGFGRQGEKHAGLKGFLISRPVESLPRYNPGNSGGSRSGRSNRSSAPSSRSASPVPIQDPPAANRI